MRVPDVMGRLTFARIITFGPLTLIIALCCATFALSRVEAQGLCDVSPAESALDSEEQAFLVLINQYRQQNGRGALAAGPHLNASAQWIARDEALHGAVLSHTDSLGRGPSARASDCGYPYGAGENAASGNTQVIGSAQQVLQAWKGSPGHNANMLNPGYVVIGIGRAVSPVNGWVYWFTPFGGYADVGAPTPTLPTLSPTPTRTPVPTPTPPPTLIPRSHLPELARD